MINETYKGYEITEMVTQNMDVMFFVTSPEGTPVEITDEQTIDQCKDTIDEIVRPEEKRLEKEQEKRDIEFSKAEKEELRKSGAGY